MDVILNALKSFVPQRRKKESGEPVSISQKHTNPFNEITLLPGHTDIIRTMLLIDDDRFASASDDGQVIIWSTHDDSCQHCLVGHTQAVTCMLVVNNGQTLVTGSADRTLRFWSIATGACLRTLTAHEGSVRCLVSISADRFCSGGNDRNLCVWDNSGEFFGSIERQEEENLHCLLAISNDRLITGSNSAILLVYRTDTLKFCQILAEPHRESVRCLAKVNDDKFVSGSLDGVIVVWQSEGLVPLRKLANPDNYFTKSDTYKFYPFCVNNFFIMGKRYVAACVGKGFQVYDSVTGERVMDNLNAHASLVNSIISIWGGRGLVSCSGEGCLRLWTSTKDFNFELIEDESKAKKKIVYPPLCRGEMWGHTGEIKILLKFSETSFASAGHDNLIIHWKDGDLESLGRNSTARLSLFQENSQLCSDLFDNSLSRLNSEADFQDDQDDSGLVTATEGEDEEYAEDKNREDDDDEERKNRYFYESDGSGDFTKYRRATAAKIHGEGNQSESNTSRTSEEVADNNSGGGPILVSVTNKSQPNQPKNVRVPSYILDFAENLYSEEGKTLQEIREDLKQQGHSEAIVEAVIIKLSNPN